MVEKLFELTVGGSGSTAVDFRRWDQMSQDGMVSRVMPFDGKEGFSVWKDESGNYYKVNYQPQKEGMVSTNEPKQTFANAVALTEEEKKRLLG